MQSMQSIVVLISGRGSNMQALVQACQFEAWNARVVAVLSQRADAQGLAWASAQGIPTQAIEPAAYATRAEFDTALADAVAAYAPSVVVLAGFMRILGAEFVQRFEGRLVNIHPSLLPAFAGLHTHERALAAGCKFAGATVHLVTPALDAGPIVLQAAVPVLAGDDAKSLAARVLQAEHVILPRAVRWLLEGQLAVHNGVVRHLGAAPQWLWFEAGEGLAPAAQHG